MPEHNPPLSPRLPCRPKLIYLFFCINFPRGDDRHPAMWCRDSPLFFVPLFAKAVFSRPRTLAGWLCGILLPLFAEGTMKSAVSPVCKSGDTALCVGCRRISDGGAGYARMAAMASSMPRVCCSPVVMFLSVTTPSRISFSPTRATKGIWRALAYDICFFIFAVSG